jgi:hypothetical protein
MPREKKKNLTFYYRFPIVRLSEKASGDELSKKAKVNG